MRPSVRQLEYLVAVASSLNFREAAKHCHVSQPALSAQIAALEGLLGVTLFERDRRRVMLTEAGRVVAERARTLLGELDDLVAAARTHAQALRGVVRIGVIPTIAPYVMPGAQVAISQTCPDLDLLWREEQTSRLVELLAEGKLDALLLALEADIGNLETRALFRDSFFFAACEDHALARRKNLRERDLRGQKVLLLEDGHCLKEQAWAICQAHGVEQVDFRATSLNTLVQMVSAGAGITLLPAMALASEARVPGLVTVPFAKPVPYRTIGLAWRKTSPRVELFETLAQILGTLGEGGRPRLAS
jgi:LysR family transcriptional regulator, hydrogen peroxide-inducible genes activator